MRVKNDDAGLILVLTLTCILMIVGVSTLSSGTAPIPVAQAIINNPTDVVLRADFPQGNAQTVVGFIQFSSENGTTKVHVDVTGLPKNSGMFAYHIHDKPVGADKSCAGTGPHFNPFAASADCEAMGDDSLCEIGDLSGKHGLINTTCFELFYHDPYLSLDPANPQYIGNKAINIHLDNGDRLACATIKPSREPEDLLLLNAETESEEVRKFEDLAGISHSSTEASLQATAVHSDENSLAGASTQLPTDSTTAGITTGNSDLTTADSEETNQESGDIVDEVEDVEADSDMGSETLLTDHTVTEDAIKEKSELPESPLCDSGNTAGSSSSSAVNKNTNTANVDSDGSTHASTGTTSQLSTTALITTTETETRTITSTITSYANLTVQTSTEAFKQVIDALSGIQLPWLIDHSYDIVHGFVLSYKGSLSGSLTGDDIMKVGSFVCCKVYDVCATHPVILVIIVGTPMFLLYISWLIPLLARVKHQITDLINNNINAEADVDQPLEAFANQQPAME